MMVIRIVALAMTELNNKNIDHLKGNEAFASFAVEGGQIPRCVKRVIVLIRGDEWDSVHRRINLASVEKDFSREGERSDLVALKSDGIPEIFVDHPFKDSVVAIQNFHLFDDLIPKDRIDQVMVFPGFEGA